MKFQPGDILEYQALNGERHVRCRIQILSYAEIDQKLCDLTINEHQPVTQLCAVSGPEVNPTMFGVMICTEEDFSFEPDLFLGGFWDDVVSVTRAGKTHLPNDPEVM